MALASPAMGDFAADTEVVGSDGRYRAKLSRDWEIWGPNGGYLATILLRACGAHSGLPRPASLACHFVGVADFAEIDVEVATVKRGRRSESMRASMTQDGRPVCEALAWAIDEGRDDREWAGHDAAESAGAPAPSGIPEFRERLAADPEAPSVHPFWDNFDYHPLRWVDQQEWEQRDPGEPVFEAWLRWRPTPTFDDPYVDAGRSVVLADTFMWPAAVGAYRVADLDFHAPSLDVSVQFHRLVPDSEYLFVRARSPVGQDALVGGTAAVWSDDGRLLASGGQQMLCRRVPAP